MQVLFRAKEKNSNNYVIGYEYYNHIEDEYYITHYVSGSNYKVDRTTRSINIEDMLDSQGNKIFASLDIKGGSLIEYEEKIFEAMYLNGLIQGVANMDSIQNSLFKYSKIIGIQQ